MRGSCRFGWMLLALAAPLWSVAAESACPQAPVREVRNVYFGTEVVDPYRWMEQPDSAELAAYLKAQNACTRAALARLDGPRGQLLQRIRQLQRGTAAVRFVSRAGDRYFFLQTPGDSERARLMERSVAGGDARVLLDPERFATPGSHASIDFYSVSKDGRYVAAVISHGGGEDWSFRFIDSRTDTLLPERVDHLGDPFPGWSTDGRSLYYARLQTLPPGAPAAAKLDNMRVYRHRLGSDPATDAAVFGAGVEKDIPLPTQSFPSVRMSSDGRYEIAAVAVGTENTQSYWLRDLKASTPRWRQVAGRADRLTALLVHRGRAYAISQKTSDGRVIAFDAAQGDAAHGDVIAGGGGLVVSAENGELAAAADALYVAGQRNGVGVVLRVPYDRAEARELALPAEGELIEFDADEAQPGVVFALQSPTLSPRVYRYDPRTQAATDTGLYVADPADFSAIVTHTVEVESTDGARVPVSITMRRDLALDGSHPLLLTVYGSYGAIVPAWFSAPNLAWYERGGILAFVHARGGGEKGEAWHQAAIKTRKQHTVDDVIAAARWLIAAKYTSPAHLAVAGKSAGGLPTGAAIVQHPELFRAALIRVGISDMLRLEQGSLGAANTREFGSVEHEGEFRALLAISPYANVRKGVAYPAVLLETGINDPRVPSWQLAKMTARLQAATSSGRPVLLRVDYDAGHGLGSDKDQVAELMADEYAFLGWQLGMPGFVPH